MQDSSKTLVLAFSGGLDTSYCVPRLREQGWTVHTVFVNTGGATAEQREAIRRQGLAVGAASHQELDARAEVYDRFVRFLIQGNVLRGEVYPLSVAAGALGPRGGPETRSHGHRSRVHRCWQRSDPIRHRFPGAGARPGSHHADPG
jgi:hypothetical protein